MMNSMLASIRRRKAQASLKKWAVKLRRWKLQMMEVSSNWPRVRIFYHRMSISEQISSDILALMNVGGNVVQAASKTVTKTINTDPDTVIQVR